MTNVPGLAFMEPVTIQNGTFQIRTNHVYDAQVHWLLQVANIYDARTNRFIENQERIHRPVPRYFGPSITVMSVHRIFYASHSFQEILGGSAEFLIDIPWITADQAVNRLTKKSLPEDQRTSGTGFNVFRCPGWLAPRRTCQTLMRRCGRP